MAGTKNWITRPPTTDDHSEPTRQRQIGVALAVVGVLAVLVATFGNFSAASDVASDPEGAASTLAWTFGLTTTGFAIIKTGIAVVLVGIIIRMYHRTDSVTWALPRLKAETDQSTSIGTFDSPQGSGTATASPPGPLGIHRMATRMWLPMLAMGVMVVAAGFITSLVAAGSSGESFRQAIAWTQGLSFLGETFVLAGISFLLGTILAGLRAAGGEVQASVDVTVKTLDMPTSAKAFVGLMMLGVVVGIVQFIGYVVVASNAGDAAGFAASTAWLGPLREAGLGLLLSGIVLALYTISKVLAFQFSRVREIIATGA